MYSRSPICNLRIGLWRRRWWRIVGGRDLILAHPADGARFAAHKHLVPAIALLEHKQPAIGIDMLQQLGLGIWRSTHIQPSRVEPALGFELGRQQRAAIVEIVLAQVANNAV